MSNDHSRSSTTQGDWTRLTEIARAGRGAFDEARLDDELARQIRRGANRFSAYRALFELSCHPAVSAEASDYLTEVLTAITGDCSADSILRFAGDPEDQEELVAYVRRGSWRRDSRWPATVAEDQNDEGRHPAG